MQRTRDALPGGVLWTSLLVFLRNNRTM